MSLSWEWFKRKGGCWGDETSAGRMLMSPVPSVCSAQHAQAARSLDVARAADGPQGLVVVSHESRAQSMRISCILPLRCFAFTVNTSRPQSRDLIFLPAHHPVRSSSHHLRPVLQIVYGRLYCMGGLSAARTFAPRHGHSYGPSSAGSSRPRPVSRKGRGVRLAPGARARGSSSPGAESPRADGEWCVRPSWRVDMYVSVGGSGTVSDGQSCVVLLLLGK